MNKSKNRRPSPILSPNAPLDQRPFFRVRALHAALLTLAVLCAYAFFVQPQPLFSSADETFSRFFTAVLPLLNPALIVQLWGCGAGTEWLGTPFFFSEVFSFGVMAMAFVLGWAVLSALRLTRCLRSSETFFFGATVGLALMVAATGMVKCFDIGPLSNPCRWNLFFCGVQLSAYLAPLLFYGFLLQRIPNRRRWKKQFDSPMPQHIIRRRLWRRLRLSFAPLEWSLLAFALFFAALVFFAGTIPPFDYDVLEYHAQAGRELAVGPLRFFPHNAYLNMPLGAEMFYYWGNLFFSGLSGGSAALSLADGCGKTLLALCAPLGALGLYAFCGRFLHSRRTGLLAAVCYLAFCDNFQCFASGLNDGLLGLATLASLYAFCLWRRRGLWQFALLTGIGVGLAVSIKYTAVVFVAIPVFAAMIFAKVRSVSDATAQTSERRAAGERGKIVSVIVFFLAAICIGGVWYVKNWYYTGNPVWPLAVSVFGDSTRSWTPEIAARWASAHSSSDFSFGAFYNAMADFFARDRFASPFLAVFGVLVFWFVATQPKARSVSDGATERLSKGDEVTGSAQKIVFAHSFGMPFLPKLFHFFQYTAERLRDPASLRGVTSKKIAWNGSIKNFFRKMLKFRRRRPADSAGPNQRAAGPLVEKTLFVYALFFIALWFFATHRLLRFLVPVMPILAILVAAGLSAPAESIRPRFGQRVLYALFFFCALYSLSLDALTSSDLLTPREKILCDTARFGDWSVWFEENPVGDGHKLLLVGEARAAAYRVPLLYSTCWNRSPLVDVLPKTVLDRREKNAFDFTGEEIAQIKENLAEKKIGLILVDFGEIERFNSAGNYGLTDSDLLRRELFDALIKAGIIEAFRPKEYDTFAERTKQKTAMYRVQP